MAGFENLVVNGRLYVPVLLIDADGRTTEMRIRDNATLSRTRPVNPYICTDCLAITVDPDAHNEVHDGPTCRVCGCTEDRACDTPEGPCRWVEADLCSNPDCVGAAAQPAVTPAAVVDLVAALRSSVEAATARREEAGRG